MLLFQQRENERKRKARQILRSCQRPEESVEREGNGDTNQPKGIEKSLGEV